MVGLRPLLIMFGISFLELLVIFVVALLVYGPEELPSIAKKVGGVAAQFQKVAMSVRREFFNAMYTPAQDDFRNMKRELTNLQEEVSAKTDQKPKQETPKL